MKNKRKIAFIALFVLSFLPALGCVAWGGVDYFCGARFLGDTVYYGWDAFSIGLLVGFVWMTFYYPVLPACLLFQLCFVGNGIMKLFKLGKRVRIAVHGVFSVVFIAAFLYFHSMGV